MANMQILAAQKRIKESALAELETRAMALSSKRKELETRADKIETEQDLDTLTADSDRNDTEIKENTEQQKLLRSEIDDIDGQMAGYEKRAKAAVKAVVRKGTEMSEELQEKRAEINAYLHKRAEPGIISSTVDVTIPEEILYNPRDEIKTLDDLSKFVTIAKVRTASGKYPIRKKASASLSTVAELEKNPKLADPSFLEVSWEVKTYRGAIAISQESIDDSAIDLIPLVARDAQEQKLNTINAKIAAVLKTFTPVTAGSIDDIKEIINVKLDRAYERKIIASSSFYHAVDTLKDKQGRYLLQEDIASPTGHVFLGMPIAIVNDTLLGATGEAKAFIGDSRRGVLYADRADLEVKWVDHHIYGEYLRAGMRMDVVRADANAGYFVTLAIDADPAP